MIITTDIDFMQVAAAQAELVPFPFCYTEL